MTGRELRAQLRAQQGRNSELRGAQFSVTESCGGRNESGGHATAANHAPEPDRATERRQAKALDLLAKHPEWRYAVVTEAGDPFVHVTVAIRGVAVGEIEIPAKLYDGFALLALIDRHGGESIH